GCKPLGFSIWPLFGGTSPRRLRSSLANERGDGSVAHCIRVSGQGARMRRSRCSDARLLHQGAIARNSEEVADHGRFRRNARALGRLTWRPHSTSPSFAHASHCRQLASNSPFAVSSVATRP